MLVVVLAAAAIPDVRWRAVLVVLKAAGQLPAVDWADLAHILRPGTDVMLSRLVHYRNPFMTITNTLVSTDDRARGKELFGKNCARCHGQSAEGGAGPALVGRALTHGESDWAIFRTIRLGVPGTAMQGVPLAPDDIWRVVGYLRGVPDPSHLDDTTTADHGSLGAPVDVTDPMLRQAAASPDNWLLPSGGYNGQRFSRDAQINSGNVSRMAVRWIHQFGTADAHIESVPIVAGRFLYVTLPGVSVIALEAATGKEVWRFTHPTPADVKLCCANVNRGVAVLGRRVFIATADAHLLALDAATGRLLWDQTVADYQEGYSITSAPLPIGNLVVTGMAGGEFPTRGFLRAYDAATGEPKWRFDTVPGPGEAGHDTWGGDSWKTGGASTWVTGSYDPELGLLYWGVGNPTPDFTTAGRPGDNLFSESVLALDAATGKLVWHFQFTPGDDHDFDAVHTPVLVDAVTNGVARKLLMVANRNGFFYVLDRQTGAFIRAAPFARQTWATGLTAEGRPIKSPAAQLTAEGVYLYPSMGGATNWWPAAYSPLTALYYVLTLERGGMYFSSTSPSAPSKGKLFVGGSGAYVEGDPRHTTIRSIDPQTATVRWEHVNRTYNDQPRGGLLSTAGGLVFGSDTSTFVALDAGSGAELWSFDTGGQICAAPISYRADDQQIVAVAAGQVLIAFQVPKNKGKEH
jgi:alcohol dehydrogenase (cytochrome c)